MNFTLTQEQQIIQETAAKLAKQELESVASTLDTTKDREILKSNLKKLAVLGFNGIAIDPRYGGTGAGSVAFSLVMTELGKACAATAVTTSVTNMVAEVIHSVGTEDQKQRYIPQLCDGTLYAGSFGLTETDAGSDPAAMKTTATDRGNYWLLSGKRCSLPVRSMQPAMQRSAYNLTNPLYIIRQYSG